MAKFALIFLAVFCLIQFAVCARIPRETVEDQANQALEKIKEVFGNTFNEENFNKFLKSAQDFGDSLAKSGKEFFDKVQDKTATAPTSTS
uniref:Conserved secreted peptide1 n=1 Tax=Sergentomyia schwetzi TaxID=114605 RepID=A0A6B9VMJ3_9DIPT|nr:conserved secreted peptide1 [Sergentomyia schwetzi]